MTRVLQICRSLHAGGGVEAAVAGLVRGLRDAGVETELLIFKDLGEHGEALRDEGVVLHHRRRGPLGGLGAVLRGLPDRGWDLAHGHREDGARLAARLRSRGLVRAAFGHMHNVHSLDRPRAARRLARALPHLDLLLGPSQAVLDHAAARAGAEPARCRVLPNPIELEAFSRTRDRKALREDLGLPAEAPVLVCVARLAPVKDHGTLFRAFARILEAEPGALLLLAGGGEDAALREDARGLGLADRVRFLGRVRDVPALLAACDLAVLASSSEGFGTAAVEAGAAGLAVVATSAGGLAEAVEDGVTGRLVPPGDAAALAGAAIELLAGPETRTRLGAAGRLRARRHEVQKVVARLLDLLRRSSG